MNKVEIPALKGPPDQQKKNQCQRLCTLASFLDDSDGELLEIPCTSLKTSATLIQQIFIALWHCSSCLGYIDEQNRDLMPIRYNLNSFLLLFPGPSRNVKHYLLFDKLGIVNNEVSLSEGYLEPCL